MIRSNWRWHKFLLVSKNNTNKENKMTATTTTKTRRPAVKKATEVTPAPIVISHKDDTLRLIPGVYLKIGRIRRGKAFLEVGLDGSLGYTNRRRESRVVTAKEFIQIYKTGIATKVA
jgi:hypothetical protein